MQTILTDGWILLRPFSPADAPAWLEVARESSEEIGRWMAWADSVTDPDGAQRFIQKRLDERSKGEAHMFAAVDAATGRMLGGGGLIQINRKHGIANVADRVRPSERGRGIVVAVVRLLAPFGSGAQGLQRSEIVVEPSNEPSRPVAARAIRSGGQEAVMWTQACRAENRGGTKTPVGRGSCQAAEQRVPRQLAGARQLRPTTRSKEGPRLASPLHPPVPARAFSPLLTATSVRNRSRRRPVPSAKGCSVPASASAASRVMPTCGRWCRATSERRHLNRMERTRWFSLSPMKSVPSLSTKTP